MGSRDHDGVVGARVERLRDELGAVLDERGDVRVVVGDVRAGVLEQLDQLHGGRLAHVGDIRLVGDAEHEDPRALERLARAVVERLRDARAAVVRHVLVDLAGELDEAGREVVLARLPREVERVDRDAVAAEAGARIEAHEPERLGVCRVDDLPDVDSHPIAQLGELVDERDVDRAEDVLEQLRQLGRLRGRDAMDGVDRGAVERSRCLGRGLR